MSQIFIHGGAYKTGTSFLQVLCARHADTLASHGVIYPRGHLFDAARAGEITSGNGVELAKYLRPELPHNIENFEDFPAKLSQTLSKNKGKNVLYSSEFIIFPEGERSKRIADVIRENGFVPKYVYLVRDLDKAAYSTYSQQVKRSGETRSFSEFMKTWEPLYRYTIKCAVSLFGSENIIVLNYDDNRDKLANLFFREALGLDWAPDEQMVVNRSLSPKETEMLRLINESAPNNRKTSTFISDALMTLRHGQDSLKLTHEEARILQVRFGSAVDYVNSFVRGRGTTAVSGPTVETREPIAVSDFERAMLAIVARLTLAVLR